MFGMIFRSVKVYLISVAVIATAAALVATIYLTEDSLQWIAFLTGVLMASVLAAAVRASRSEMDLLQRTEELAEAERKIELELGLRKNVEEKVAVAQGRLQLIDDKLPTMIVLIDIEGYCRYHNSAFRNWLNLKTGKIDGRTMRELLGSKAYADIATAFRQSLDGKPLRYEHIQEMSDGVIYRLMVEHVPQFDAAGKVTGFYFLATDITRHDDVSAGQSATATESSEHYPGHGKVAQFGAGKDEGRLFITAILDGEFSLYCQLISPLPVNSGKAAHYEILIRMSGDEGSLIPPGAFFPLAEKAGLMPYLDRWVVQQVLIWVADQQRLGRATDSIFFINVAQATIGDLGFPSCLKGILDETGVAGSALCFEVSASDLTARSHSVVEFITQVRACGCAVALSGFGGNAALFDQIRGFQVEFLKIDGSTILNMLGSPENLAKVVSICRVANKIGVKTVAEMVESDEVAGKLSEIGVDFVQGFGVSRPRPLVE